MPNRRRRRTRRTRARTPLPPLFRRRSTMWLVAAVLTLSVGLLLGLIANVTGGGDGGSATPTAPASRPSPGATALPTPALAVDLPAIQPDPSLLEPASVVRVIDGDTIDVELGGTEERVRYYGIDTPERGEPCYGDATDRNEALVGDAVLLLPDARERDSFGRLLRYVFTADGDSVDAQLIAEGLASAWTADGQYRNQLIALESQARSEQVGCLWR